MKPLLAALGRRCAFGRVPRRPHLHVAFQAPAQARATQARVGRPCILLHSSPTALDPRSCPCPASLVKSHPTTCVHIKRCATEHCHAPSTLSCHQDCGLSQHWAAPSSTIYGDRAHRVYSAVHLSCFGPLLLVVPPRERRPAVPLLVVPLGSPQLVCKCFKRARARREAGDTLRARV